MRLIDADAFWASVVQSRKETIIDDDVKISMGEFVKLLDNAPTIEYPFYREAYQTGYEEGKKERPHGKWIKINPEPRGYAEIFRCSNCLTNVQLSYWGKECDYPNCPYCLADMKEADNEHI